MLSLPREDHISLTAPASEPREVRDESDGSPGPCTFVGLTCLYKPELQHPCVPIAAQSRLAGNYV